MNKIDLNQWVSKFKLIEEREEKLALLSKLSQMLNSTLDRKEAQRRAIEAATQLIKAETAFLFLVGEEKHQLYFEVVLSDRERGN